MNNRLPWDVTAFDADDDGGPPAGAQVGRRLVVAMLLTAAALDLTRCGLVLAAARHPSPAAGLVTAGLAAAALTAQTARGCQAGQRWAGWAALLIGAASAPQAAASGFRSPYTIPDTATAALGILLAITILATAGRVGRRDTTLKPPCHGQGSHAATWSAASPAQACGTQHAFRISRMGGRSASPSTPPLHLSPVTTPASRRIRRAQEGAEAMTGDEGRSVRGSATSDLGARASLWPHA